MTVLTSHIFDSESLARLCLGDLMLRGNLLVGLLLHRRFSVPLWCTPLSLRWLPLFFDICALCGKNLEVCARLEFGGFLEPFPDILVECFYLCQRGDTFWHHHVVGNYLPSYSCKLSPLIDLVNEVGKRFCGVIGPHHLELFFSEVNFVNSPIQPEYMLQHI